MAYLHCTYCGTAIEPGQTACPICGRTLAADDAPQAEYRREKSSILPTIIAGIILFAAFGGGLLFDASRRAPVETPTATPEIVETAAPTPTPTPTVTGLRLYTFGRELDADGFTAYVGDKAFTLTVELEPELRHPDVSWFITDSHGSDDSASLAISNDGLSCEFTALKPTGRNELTVRCFGTEVVIPVFLWER